jgi:hypothetical protein
MEAHPVVGEDGVGLGRRGRIRRDGQRNAGLAQGGDQACEFRACDRSRFSSRFAGCVLEPVGRRGFGVVIEGGRFDE